MISDALDDLFKVFSEFIRRQFRRRRRLRQIEMLEILYACRNILRRIRSGPVFLDLVHQFLQPKPLLSALQFKNLGHSVRCINLQLLVDRLIAVQSGGEPMLSKWNFVKVFGGSFGGLPSKRIEAPDGLLRTESVPNCFGRRRLLLELQNDRRRRRAIELQFPLCG